MEEKNDSVPTKTPELPQNNETPASAQSREQTASATNKKSLVRSGSITASLSANEVVRGDKLTWSVSGPTNVTWLRFSGSDENGNAYTSYYKYSIKSSGLKSYLGSNTITMLYPSNL